MAALCLLLLFPLAHAFNLTKFPVPDIPDAYYNLPPNALFVALNGEDTNAGTRAAPLRNLRTALERVEENGAIVLRGGLYYNVSLGEITKLGVTIQPFRHERVYLLGSVLVEGWTKAGANWAVEWSNPFAAYQPDAACTQLDDTGFKCRPEQVFVGGEPLTQVGAESAVKKGTFFVDNAAGRLLIGSDPTGRTVEASVQENALVFTESAHQASIYGIGFAQYGSHLGSGAVISSSELGVFYYSSFVQNAGDGLMLNGSSLQDVRDCLLNYNGMRGFYGKKASDLLFTSNSVDFNFQRAPNFAACTGDSCLLAAADIGHPENGVVSVLANTFHSNRANGLRVTVGAPSDVTRNFARGNTLAGFVFARANDGVFASNVAVNNAVGMHVISCPGAFVYNNDLVGNKQGLVVTATPPTKNSLVRVRNNLFSNNLERQLSVTAATQADLATTFGIFDHNGYYQRNATGTRPFQWGNQTFVYHAGFVAACGFDKAPPSIDIRNQAAQPFFVNEGAGNYNLRPTSVAVKKGAQLPERIALALGVKATPVNMGALKWRGQ
ncbi:Parallel beta-helix repeat protein [Aphelenchoides fujianensis]|nr:Parallel beta-helix repeat protein [Aphelenchoides fujianensis]